MLLSFKVTVALDVCTPNSLPIRVIMVRLVVIAYSDSTKALRGSVKNLFLKFCNNFSSSMFEVSRSMPIPGEMMFSIEVKSKKLAKALAVELRTHKKPKECQASKPPGSSWQQRLSIGHRNALSYTAALLVESARECRIYIS